MGEYVRRWQAVQEANPAGEGGQRWLLPRDFANATAYLGPHLDPEAECFHILDQVHLIWPTSRFIRPGTAAPPPISHLLNLSQSAPLVSFCFVFTNSKFIFCPQLRSSAHFRDQARAALAATGVFAQPRLAFRSRFVHMEGFTFDWMRRPGASAKRPSAERNWHQNDFVNFHLRQLAPPLGRGAAGGGIAAEEAGAPPMPPAARVQTLGYELGYLESHWLNFVSREYPDANAASVYHN